MEASSLVNKAIQNQWDSRKPERFNSLIHSESKDNENNEFLILQSPSDAGVIRNGGKRGSYLAPKALLNTFAKLQIGNFQKPIFTKEVTNLAFESVNFSKSWQSQKNKILNTLGADNFKCIHLGGGHDHIYPALIALEEKLKAPLVVINLDAHLDTKLDKESHSGTPFRQFAQSSKYGMTLIQVGIHPFANAQGNYEKLSDTSQMYIFDIEFKLEDIKALIPNNANLVLSLDCDAIDGSIFPAVSACNHHGLTKQQVKNLVNLYLEHLQAWRFFGIYEFNPVYDTINKPSANFISSLIYQMLTH